MATWIYFQDTGLGVNLEATKTIYLDKEGGRIQIEFPGDEQCMEIAKTDAADPAVFEALFEAIKRYIEKNTLDVNVSQSGA